jgi:hypothetical protein
LNYFCHYIYVCVYSFLFLFYISKQLHGPHYWVYCYYLYHSGIFWTICTIFSLGQYKLKNSELPTVEVGNKMSNNFHYWGTPHHQASFKASSQIAMSKQIVKPFRHYNQLILKKNDIYWKNFNYSQRYYSIMGTFILCLPTIPPTQCMHKIRCRVDWYFMNPLDCKLQMVITYKVAALPNTFNPMFTKQSPH